MVDVFGSWWQPYFMPFEVVAIMVVVWMTVSVVVALVTGAMIRLRDTREHPRQLHVAGASECE